MEGVDWVLVHKDEEALYIQCTLDYTGRSKGRPRWQWTTDFRLATGFKDYDDIASKVKLHRIPLATTKHKPYTNAASEWHQRQ